VQRKGAAQACFGWSREFEFLHPLPSFLQRRQRHGSFHHQLPPGQVPGHRAKVSKAAEKSTILWMFGLWHIKFYW